MEKLTRYRTTIKQFIQQESLGVPSHGDIEAIAFCDEDQGQYQLLHLGWSQVGRVFNVIIHIRLCDDKIWIERDGTADSVARRLEQVGIPRDDIVLAFHPVWKRPFTEYAVA